MQDSSYNFHQLNGSGRLQSPLRSLSSMKHKSHCVDESEIDAIVRKYTQAPLQAQNQKNDHDYQQPVKNKIFSQTDHRQNKSMQFSQIMPLTHNNSLSSSSSSVKKNIFIQNKYKHYQQTKFEQKMMKPLSFVDNQQNKQEQSVQQSIIQRSQIIQAPELQDLIRQVKLIPGELSHKKLPIFTELKRTPHLSPISTRFDETIKADFKDFDDKTPSFREQQKNQLITPSKTEFNNNGSFFNIIMGFVGLVIIILFNQILFK